jgi:hypothetical protein
MLLDSHKETRLYRGLQEIIHEPYFKGYIAEFLLGCNISPVN